MSRSTFRGCEIANESMEQDEQRTISRYVRNPPRTVVQAPWEACTARGLTSAAIITVGQSLGKQPNSLPGPPRSFPRRVARTTWTHVTAPCSAERLNMTGGQLQGEDGHLEVRLPKGPRGPEYWVDRRLAFFIRLAHLHLPLVHLCRLCIVSHRQRKSDCDAECEVNMVAQPRHRPFSHLCRDA